MCFGVGGMLSLGSTKRLLRDRLALRVFCLMVVVAIFLDISVQCKDDEGREAASIKDRWMKGKQRRMLLIIFDFFLSHECVP